MKKLFRSLFALAFGAIAFTSCEDVPQPYDTPHGDDPTPVEGEYLNESFSTDFGKFEEITTKGVAWMIDFSTAKASGYNSSDKTNTESQSFLVSPNVDLSKSTGAYLEFEYIFRYKSNDGRDLVLITDNYTGDPTTTEWKDITGDLTEGSDWNTWYKYSYNIPEQYIGKPNVRIALYYDASSKSSRTWEVKNLLMKEGQVDLNIEPKDFDINGQGGGGSSEGKGSYDDPYTVGEAITATSATGVYVKGYIVGFVNGTKYVEGSTFSATGASASNILIAASATEKDPTKCMPVQLVANTDVRAKVNLKDNPNNLGQEVLLYGDLTTYFNVPGIKNTSYAELNGQAIGTKPGGGGGGDQGTASYTLVTAGPIAAGKYVFATPFANDQYIMMKPLGASATYGWLPCEQTTFASNKITTSEANEFTLTKLDPYFVIQDSQGRFYYMKDNYDNFNVAASLPEGTVPNDYLWNITIDNDFVVSITNVGKQKTIFKKADFNTYGAYATGAADNDLPRAFKK